MPRLSCEKIKDSLINCDELDQNVEKHLKSCPDCKEEFEVLKQIYHAGSPVLSLAPSRKFLNSIEKKCGFTDASDSSVPSNSSLAFSLAVILTALLSIASLVAYNYTENNVKNPKKNQIENNAEKKTGEIRNLLIDTASTSTVMKFEAPEKKVD